MADQDFKNKLQFKDPTEPEELILDNKKIMAISNVTNADKNDFTPLTDLINLRSLSMNRTHLYSLEGFPTLPKLRRLALSDNKLTGGLEALADAKLEKLIHLDLSGNKINDLSALEPLCNLSNLKHLSLFECPVTQKANYRDALLEMIPQLYSLDQHDRKGDPIDSEDESDADEEEDEEEEEEEDDADVVQSNGHADSEDVDENEENEENQEAEISEEAASEEDAGSESDRDAETNDNEEVSDNEEELEASGEEVTETNVVPKSRDKGKQVAFPPDVDKREESESESEVESGEEGPGIDYLLDPNLPEDTDEEDFQPDEDDEDEESDQLDEASDIDLAEFPTTSAAGAAFEAAAAASSTSKRKGYDDDEEEVESSPVQKRVINDDDETIQSKKRRV